MSNNRKHIILFAVVALIGGTILCFCGNNPAHQTSASHILSYNECLDCHDHSVEKTITICLGKECLFKDSHSMYDAYPPPGKEDCYAPASAIEQAGGVLEKGHTTCLSCHNLTRPPPHLLKDGTEFCEICHIDKKSIK
jgi:hypothetical protein